MCGFGCVVRVTRSDPDAAARFGHLGEPALPLLEQAIPDDWLDLLDEHIEHRGPDGCGRLRGRSVRDDGSAIDIAIVDRRLSIIDHKTGGQPMVSDSPDPVVPGSLTQGKGRVAVAFNGCIYNHRDLRAQLEALGHAFATDHSDTEVLIHGWRAWGDKLFEQLTGMCGGVIWDEHDGKAVFFRDRFGEKPVYLSGVAGQEVWLGGSNALGLARLVCQITGRTTLREDALRDWVRFGYAADTTPYESVVQLVQGATIEAPNKSRAFDPDKLHKKGLAGRKPGAWARARPRMPGRGRVLDEIEAHIDRSVRARLEADVPIGCFLSGGVDSSLIARHAQAALGEQGGQLTTICVRMPDPAYDESGYAQVAADAIGSHHIVVDAEPDPCADLELLIQTLGLPFADSSLLPTFWACKAAAGEVGCVLSGDGGDELFLGYERYKAAGDLWLGGLFGWLASTGLIRRGDPKGKGDKLARLLIAGQHAGYRDLISIFPTPDVQRLLGVDPLTRMLKKKDTGDRHDSTEKARNYDLRHHLPGDMLRKVDAASMLAGVEVRSPLLDGELAGAVLALPVRTVRMKRQRKGLLRAIARRHLPVSIVDRTKMGFAIPVGRWFRDDFGGMRAMLHDHLRSRAPFPGVPLGFDFAYIARLLDEHDAGKRDHSQRLYALLVLSVWAKWVETLG